MKRYYYTHQATRGNPAKKILRGISLLCFTGGVLCLGYVMFPLISWQLFFAPVIQTALAAPIPKTTIVSSDTMASLFTQATASLDTNYSDPQNWFPHHRMSDLRAPRIASYTLSIPKLGIKHAFVSTVDNDLDHHLINFAGTAVPPDNGTTVIFGHSTLPQLFNPKNYKAIFATLHTIQVGDTIDVTINDVSYQYRIYAISIVNPDDESVFTQQTDNSYLTIVTCTPPGTTWKRLIIHSRLEKV